MIDQKNRQLAVNESEDFQDEFTKNIEFTRKPLYFILCPAFIDIFMLENLKWSGAFPFPSLPSADCW